MELIIKKKKEEEEIKKKLDEKLDKEVIAQALEEKQIEDDSILQFQI